MRAILVPSLSFLALAGCGGGSATVDGAAGSIQWGDTRWVFVGARYLVISAAEVECEAIDWIDSHYDEGVAPTPADTSILQFTFSGDEVQSGKFSIAPGAAVQASILNVDGGVFHEYPAAAGTITVDSYEAEGSTTGTFESATFEDGTLSGEFTAEWCVNLKP